MKRSVAEVQSYLAEMHMFELSAVSQSLILPLQKGGEGESVDFVFDLPSICPLGLACNKSLALFAFTESRCLDCLPPQKPTCPKSNSTRIEDPNEYQLRLMWLPLQIKILWH